MLFIFPVDLSYFLMSFPEGLPFFSISYKTTLLATNLFSHCVPGNVFILPSFLKKNFVYYICLMAFFWMHSESIIPLPSGLHGFR